MRLARSEEPFHGRRDDRRAQPKSPPRLHDRRDVRGGHRLDRDGDQVAPSRQGQPVRMRTPGSSVARHGSSAPTSRRSKVAIATTTSPSGPASCSSIAPRSTSCSARRRPRARRSSRFGSTSTRRGGPRSSSALPAASSSMTAAATSPSGTHDGMSPANWPTRSAAGRDRDPRSAHDRARHRGGRRTRGRRAGAGHRRRREWRGGRHDVRGDDLAPGAPRRPASADAARATRLPGGQLQPDPPVVASRSRRGLRDHGAGRVPGDVRHEHDVRRDGPARDRDGADDRAVHRTDSRVTGRPDPGQGRVPRRQGHGRHVPKRAGLRDTHRGTRRGPPSRHRDRRCRVRRDVLRHRRGRCVRSAPDTGRGRATSCASPR